MDRTVGRRACQAFFVLSLAYVPAMLAGFVANGGFDKPIADPYLAVMELLILLAGGPAGGGLRLRSHLRAREAEER